MSGEVTVLRRQVSRLEDEAEIARRLAAFDAPGSDRERIYRFISTEAANFHVALLCRVCRVSRSAYYAFVARARRPSEAIWAEARLANRIYDIWVKSRSAYGVPRVTAELWREGVQVNGKKVARLMAEIGISGRSGRRRVVTTRRDPSKVPAPDLVGRNFSACAPGELLVSDITYIPTDEGFLYAMTILDVYSRVVIGWSIAAHMRTELCLDALSAAATRCGRKFFVGTVLHSDH